LLREGWSRDANGREPKSSMGQVVNFKLGSFYVIKEMHRLNTRPCLKKKTQPSREVLMKEKAQYE
jgi:hypothetical protein